MTDTNERALFDCFKKLGLVKACGSLVSDTMTPFITIEEVVKPKGVEGTAAVVTIKFLTGATHHRHATFLVGVNAANQRVYVYRYILNDPLIEQVGREHNGAKPSTDAALLDIELLRLLNQKEK